MAIVWSNNASTTISGSITPTSTSVSLSAGTGANFPNPISPNIFKATIYDQATKSIYEIVHVTARSGDVCTLLRAQEGTTAQAWNAGDIFANLITAGTLSSFTQTGAGPLNTSQVYVGDDTSTTPNLIIANTSPALAPNALALGMLFTIRVKNTNTASVNVQLNGGSSILLKRTDGSNLVGGNVVAGQEYVFVYNGTNLNSTIPPIPQAPKQTTFYVSPSGSDSTGDGYSPATAFATPQGAVNNISKNYISQTGINVVVANGVYNGGFQVGSGYIASWTFTGNPSGPGNVILDATSTSSTPPVTGGPLGCAVQVTGTANVTVNGFMFRSYLPNAQCTGGFLTLLNCSFTTPVNGSAVMLAGGSGDIGFTASTVAGAGLSYSGTATCQALFCAIGGTVNSSGHSIYGSIPVPFSIGGSNPIFSAGTAYATTNGTVVLDTTVVSFSGTVPTGKAYLADHGGGINGASVLPGTQAGTADATTFGWAI